MKNESGVQQLVESREERLSKHPQQPLLIGTERAWSKFAEGSITMNELLQAKPIRDLVDRKAIHYGSRYRNFRLTREDFVSAFWEETWKVCGDYSWHSRYFLYETLQLALDRRAIDVVRRETRYKRYAWYTASPLPDGFEQFYSDGSVDVAKEVTDRIAVQEVLNHWGLNELESLFLKAVYEDPDASLQELADRLGLSNKMAAARLRARIGKKLKTLCLRSINIGVVTDRPKSVSFESWCDTGRISIRGSNDVERGGRG